MWYGSIVDVLNINWYVLLLCITYFLCISLTLMLYLAYILQRFDFLYQRKYCNTQKLKLQSTYTKWT
jgi:hypothetical protein